MSHCLTGIETWGMNNVHYPFRSQNTVHTTLTLDMVTISLANGGGGIVHKVSLSFLAPSPPPSNGPLLSPKQSQAVERAANFAKSLAANFNGHVGPQRLLTQVRTSELFMRKSAFIIHYAPSQGFRVQIADGTFVSRTPSVFILA